MNPLSPSTWSAKAQALAVALVPVVVALLNHFLKWNIDPKTIIGMLFVGGAGAASVAHIDNGEPAGPAVKPTVPAAPVPTPEEAAVLAKFNRLGLALILCLVCLAGCATGVGRAASLAVSGVPASVPTALDSIEAEYDLRANYELRDIDASTPATPEGIAAQAKAHADLQARIDAEHSLVSSLRTWIGVEKGASPTATQDAAAAARTALLDETIAKIAAAKLKAQAAKAPPEVAK